MTLWSERSAVATRPRRVFESRATQWALVAVGVAILVLVAARAALVKPEHLQIYLGAASAIWNGERLYELGLYFRDHGYTLWYPNPRPTPLWPYVYPPALAIALIPLTTVPFESARVLWFGLSLGAFLGTIWLLCGMLFPARGRNRLLVTVALGGLLAPLRPPRSILADGQIDLMLLLLVTLALLAFARRIDGRAGLLLGLALAVKPTLGFLLLFFLWKGAMRTVLVAAAVSAALVLCSFAPLGIATVVDYLAVSSYWSSPSFAVSPINQSPYGFLLRHFTANPFATPIVDVPLVPALGQAVTVIVVLATLAATVSRGRSVPSIQVVLEFGVVVIGMLLVGPLSQANHYVNLLVPALALAATMCVRGSTIIAGSLAALYVLFLLMSEAWTSGARAAYLMEGHLVGLLLLAGVTIATAIRLRTSSTALEERESRAPS